MSALVAAAEEESRGEEGRGKELVLLLFVFVLFLSYKLLGTISRL